jgi:hypothetical protein
MSASRITSRGIRSAQKRHLAATDVIAESSTTYTSRRSWRVRFRVSEVEDERSRGLGCASIVREWQSELHYAIWGSSSGVRGQALKP